MVYSRVVTLFLVNKYEMKSFGESHRPWEISFCYTYFIYIYIFINILRDRRNHFLISRIVFLFEAAMKDSHERQRWYRREADKFLIPLSLSLILLCEQRLDLQSEEGRIGRGRRWDLRKKILTCCWYPVDCW